MGYPDLVFTINKKEDVDVALAFRGMKAGGVDFREWGLLAPHPALRHRRLTRNVLRDYVERFHAEHRADLERTRVRYARMWTGLSGQFVTLTNELFGSGFPPPARYVCTVSMWNCNPRDIPHQSFQVFYRHTRPAETIVHELLHFSFYAYVYRRYPHARHPDEAQRVWELSEAFNTVMLNDPRWRTRLHLKRERPYPALRGLVRTMRAQWKKDRSVDTLLDAYFEKKKGGHVRAPTGSGSERRRSVARSRTGTGSAPSRRPR